LIPHGSLIANHNEPTPASKITWMIWKRGRCRRTAS